MPSHSPTTNPFDDKLQIPDTPEELFEQLAEPFFKELYPNFDGLSAGSQRVLRAVHAELYKGTATDGTFHEVVAMLVSLWQALNQSAMTALDEELADSEEIDDDAIPMALSMHRIDQFLQGLQVHLATLPPSASSGEPGSGWSTYRCSRSAD